MIVTPFVSTSLTWIDCFIMFRPNWDSGHDIITVNLVRAA